MAQRVAVVGFGQTHHKSSRRDVTGIELINEAVQRALEDAELGPGDIDAVVIGNMDHFENINFADMWGVEGTGAYLKPIMKLTTGGTTGTTVAIAGYHHVASGLFDVVLAVGWEKNSESDTTGATITAFDPVWERFAFPGALPGLALDAVVYMQRYGVTEKDGARVAVRDRANAGRNPYAHLRDPITVDDVLHSPMLSYPIKLLDICPRSDGAAAIILAGEEKARKICRQPAWIRSTSVCHNYTFTSDVNFGYLDTLEQACREIYKKAGIKDPRKEIDIIEMYQPCSFAGLYWLEAMGFCDPGEAPGLLWDGVTDLGGELPVNPSGGVLNANPIGATGIIRVGEVARQIQGRAGASQVPDAGTGLATGFGGCYWSDVLLLSNRPG